jgi:hypothetical protein
MEQPLLFQGLPPEPEPQPLAGKAKECRRRALQKKDQPQPPDLRQQEIDLL